MQYTIAICTRNRASLIGRTLDALQAQIDTDALHHQIEIIVVDNASTDSTAQLVRRRPTIRYIQETRLGIAWARNRAAREGQGDWLIYVDDDAVPVPDWLAHMRRCIEQLKPAPQCVIGKVALEWEGGRAAWFPTAYETLLSRYDLGEEGHFVEEGGYLLTTNAAFNRQHLLDLGGFRTDLGHRGNSLLGGEDNDIFNRLIKSSSRIWYEPQATVSHWVPRVRQTRRWLFQRVFWEGATQPLLDYGIDQPRRRYVSEMGRDVRRVGRITLGRWRTLFSTTGRLDLLLEWARQIGRFWMNWNLLRR